MTFGQSIATCFSKYCNFSGRASRSEYWWWILFTVIIGSLFGIPSGIQAVHGTSSGLPIISYIVGAILFLPSLGVLIRRLHDTGKSGWWWLISFVPVVGSIVIIIFCLMPSQPGANQYGDMPA